MATRSNEKQRETMERRTNRCTNCAESFQTASAGSSSAVRYSRFRMFLATSISSAAGFFAANVSR